MPEVHLIVTTNAPDNGRHRIDPGDRLRITIGLAPAGDLAASRLRLSIPTGWLVVDADDGAYEGGWIVWDLDPLGEGDQLKRRIELIAPASSPIDGGLDFDATFPVRLEVDDTVVAGASVGVMVAPPVAVEHTTLGWLTDLTFSPIYLPEDVTLSSVQRFDMIRVRFQVRNEDDRPVSLKPRLEYRPVGAGGFVAVPARRKVTGIAFYVGPEWVGTGQPQGGSRLGPEDELIAVDDLRSRDTSDPAQSPRGGRHSMAANPIASVELPALSYTEVEFTIRPTTDAQYLTEYAFRITDDGTPLIGAVAATLWTGTKPALLQSPIQYSGVSVAPAPGTSAAQTYRLIVPASAPVDLPYDPAAGSGGGTRYALIVATVPSTTVTRDGLGAPEVGTHGPYGMASDQCALCHRSHEAQGPDSLLVGGLPQSTLCFQCHDTAGTGADARVQAQYTDPLVPPNDPAKGSYYRHDALAPGTGHTLAEDNEFGGVSNRHDECGDCHNPHIASGEASVETPGGWTVPGQLAYGSGVSVVNGAARTAPAYTWLDGAQAKVTFEYEVCLKCHSGSTILPARDPQHPSWWAEDKGVELNPANGSFHPIEARGTNTTEAMANSLAGTSPYKLWTFTTNSTIRCVNCHGDYRKFNLLAPPPADSDLAPHANVYRGNLMQNYRDRDLKPFTEPYQASDFALCFMCHAEAPFTDGSASIRGDTNFRYHGLHLGGIRNRGNIDGDIDTPGAGRGDAICADCHFRIHSTAYAGDFRTSPPQSGTDAGLVNFAPTVTGNVGFVEWDRTGAKSGTCTLTCHGYSHEDASY